MAPSDALVIALVVGGRLLLPLGIIRFPLPAILACLVLDGVDQTIFQTFTSLSLDGYQGYDKALDIYYLTIAYIATLRNWTNAFAIPVGRFLLYYRLVGVVLFEATQIRTLLLVFPNTFEYFFDFYEGVRVRWDPRRMSPKLIIGAAAFIWIFIKLPQEWWIHVAQLDVTDTVKKIMGGTPDTPWDVLIANNIPLIVAAIVVVVALLVAAYWVITRKLPPPDRPPTFDADKEPEAPITHDELKKVAEDESRRFFDRELLEKLVLLTLVNIVFVQGLGFGASPIEASVFVVVVVLANTAVSEWLARRGHVWDVTPFIRQLLGMVALNLAIFLGLVVLLPNREAVYGAGFLLLLLTLIVTMYDRYRPYLLARHNRRKAGQAA